MMSCLWRLKQKNAPHHIIYLLVLERRSEAKVHMSQKNGRNLGSNLGLMHDCI